MRMRSNARALYKLKTLDESTAREKANEIAKNCIETCKEPAEQLNTFYHYSYVLCELYALIIPTEKFQTNYLSAHKRISNERSTRQNVYLFPTVFKLSTNSVGKICFTKICTRRMKNSSLKFNYEGVQAKKKNNEKNA